jgi:hypothetical protein
MDLSPQAIKALGGDFPGMSAKETTWSGWTLAALLAVQPAIAAEPTNNLDAALEVCNQYDPQLNRPLIIAQRQALFTERLRCSHQTPRWRERDSNSPSP